MSYVAFLRGINVGGRIVRMIDLKLRFEAMGFNKVSTVLQSGNVLFESALTAGELKPIIERDLSKSFSYSAKVQLFSLSRLKEIIEAYPFDGDRAQFQHYVVFIEASLADDLSKEASNLDPKMEEIATSQGVIYWKVRKGSSVKSPFSKYLTKSRYKDFNTVRNLNTLKKIVRI